MSESTASGGTADCLVALGANLGEPDRSIERALNRLTDLAVGSVVASGVLRTPSVGGPTGQGEFRNAVARFRSNRSAAELLDALLAVERDLGRERRSRWAARAIDLDLLLCGDTVLRLDGLRLPHPRMSFRPFVIEPAAEVAGDWRHPECGRTLAELVTTLRGGEALVRLVGDDGAVATLIASLRPTLSIRVADAGDPVGEERLTIDARPEPWPLPPSGPRLVLADGPAEHWRDEVAAALECVWPDR
ncbi:MAG: 2-amino-4-hydroxy-6-hydroxymethyldihydropteridine diphosphokinase [Planctomycetota bacterium]